MEDSPIYILEEKWFGNWRRIMADTDMKYLIQHYDDLISRIGRYGKITLRIREKGVEENDYLE